MPRKHGDAAWCVINGQEYWTQSGAERIWLRAIEPARETGDITHLAWNCTKFRIIYGKDELVRSWRPDAIITWAYGEKWVVEVKGGDLPAKSYMNMRYFCEQYPEQKLVLAWVGPVRRTGMIAKRFDVLSRCVDHVWRLPR